MLTLQEIRQLSDKNLREEITSAQNDLLKIQFEVRNGSSKESHKVRQLKKQIARLKTIEKERKSGATVLEKDTVSEKTATVKEEIKKDPVVKSKKASTASKKKTS
jgi:large subunit ribosomal protein L29